VAPHGQQRVKGRTLGSGSQVTVAITTFDRPDYLKECLASVKAQTLTGFRLVVLDNASAADYSRVLDRFRDMPMTYVRNETNIGAAGNIGKAMRGYSDSKYLVVFHDDDMMHPRMLEWQLEVLEADPEIQFVSTELAVFDDGTSPPRMMSENAGLDIEVYDDQSALARSFLGHGGLCFGSTMYRSSVLKQITPNEERFGIIWDRPFLLDAARLGKSALIRAPLVLYRHHRGQDTKTGSLSAKNLIELTRAYRAALPSDWSRADQELFYGHSRYFLTQYGYARLAQEERLGAITFVRKSIWNRVLRIRDLRHGVLEDLMRVDGRRRLPSAIEAVRGAKRRLSRRGRRAAGDQQPSLVDPGQARHQEE
jgi:glycosyltransferase involved in cell wall biosynthesis